jgi:glycolate oxidase FAD binding subunit
LTYHPPHITRLAAELEGAPDAELTVAPKSTHDVASVLHHATEKGLKVQVRGGGTRSGYGAPPPPDIVMSMERLAEVESWVPGDLTLVVGAGARIADLESKLAGENQTAVLPEVPGASTVGGAIAAGAAALRRGRLYGTRERILETTVVTGDGRIVRSGGRVVKNVTGYDMQKLSVGAFGSLGVIVSVCLRLWPVPPAGVTVTVDSPEQASTIARPLAVLEENDSTRVFLWGTQEVVSALSDRLDGESADGLDWPADPSGSYRWSLRVPPALTSQASGHLPEAWRYLAIHGVGDIRAASDDGDGAPDLRAWAESVGGHLVVVDAPTDSLEGFDPWGSPPAALDLQRRLIAEFDPARIINPGRLPGGI